MPKVISWSEYRQEHPLISLFALLAVWKSLVAVIVLTSPGIGYDTSTSLLSWAQDGSSVFLATPDTLQSSWSKFVRWDAIYYKHLAEEGHVYEQEWAWGIGLSSATSFVAQTLTQLGVVDGASSSLAAGLLLSHTAHWLSVVLLWYLTRLLTPTNDEEQQTVRPFCAAALHIISPAGVFLSAPCSESLFSLFSFAGTLGFLYASQLFLQARSLAASRTLAVASIAFALATLIRSNGILAGIPYLLEAATTGIAIVSQGLSLPRLVWLGSLITGGVCLALAMVIPQGFAYADYCQGREAGLRRPWCEQRIPSIFTWVQSHYWNVGLFRYWTLSNLPLFLLAAPSLTLLTFSAGDILMDPLKLLSSSRQLSGRATASTKRVLMGLAVPQLALAILALTSYHVQIITRLSSGYPLGYIWLADRMAKEPKQSSTIVRWMVIYALVQAGLYASFLPPA